MRLAFTRYFLFLLLFCYCQSVLAQNSSFEQKLTALKEKDNLVDWIYARLDYVAENPAKNLPYLVETQQKLWRKAKTYEEQFAFINLLNSKGYYLLRAGDILGSINSYELAYSYYLKNKLANYEIVEYTLKPLSNNYTRLGDYERALYLQKLSLNFLIKTKDKPENIAAVYSNLAISYRSMLNFSEAEKSIQVGSKLVKPTTEEQFILNNILADVLFDKKEYRTAATLIEANIKNQTPNENSAYWLMSAYTTAGNIYLGLKQTQKSDLFYAKALGIIDHYFKESRIREKANILTQRGKIKLIQNEPKLALQFFNQTLQTLKINTNKNVMQVNKIYGDNKLMEVFEQMSTAYQQLGNERKSFNSLKLALLTADKIRIEYADDITKERLQSELKVISEKAIEISYQYYQKTKDQQIWNEILLLSEQSKSRTLLDRIKKNQQLISTNQKDSLFIKKRTLEQAIIYQEKQELEGKNEISPKSIMQLKYDLSLLDNEIKLKYKQFNFDDSQMNSQVLLSALPDQHIIEYFIGAQAIYIIEIQHKKIQNLIKINDAIKISSLLQSFTKTYFQQGPTAMLNSPKTFFEASNQVYHAILDKINLAENEQLIIIPDGVLGYISFDGLLTSGIYDANIPIAKWPFLLRKATITYAFSLTTLLANKGKANPKNFTGLFITHQKNNNKPLLAVEEEAKSIKKVISGKFLMNDEVNSKSFNTAYGESKILHIGTHAYLFGIDQEPTLDFGSEKLFLFELSAKKSAPSLVVLSACRTADGLLANGEGIISLSRGFNAIGTPATIAGLWNVNDVAASVITANFYQHLTSQQSAGQALHQAKLDWLAQPKKAGDFYDLPYYWDSLIYMGVDQKIEVMTPTINWAAYGISGLFLIASITFMMRFFLARKHNYRLK